VEPRPGTSDRGGPPRPAREANRRSVVQYRAMRFLPRIDRPRSTFVADLFFTLIILYMTCPTRRLLAESGARILLQTPGTRGRRCHSAAGSCLNALEGREVAPGGVRSPARDLALTSSGAAFYRPGWGRHRPAPPPSSHTISAYFDLHIPRRFFTQSSTRPCGR